MEYKNNKFNFQRKENTGVKGKRWTAATYLKFNTKKVMKKHVNVNLYCKYFVLLKMFFCLDAAYRSLACIKRIELNLVVMSLPLNVKC